MISWKLGGWTWARRARPKAMCASGESDEPAMEAFRCKN